MELALDYLNDKNRENKDKKGEGIEKYRGDKKESFTGNFESLGGGNKDNIFVVGESDYEEDKKGYEEDGKVIKEGYEIEGSSISKGNDNFILDDKEEFEIEDDEWYEEDDNDDFEIEEDDNDDFEIEDDEWYEEDDNDDFEIEEDDNDDFEIEDDEWYEEDDNDDFEIEDEKFEVDGEGFDDKEIESKLENGVKSTNETKNSLEVDDRKFNVEKERRVDNEVNTQNKADKIDLKHGNKQFSEKIKDDIYNEKGIDYYSNMDIESLYKEVRQYMLDKGVRRRIIDLSELESKFGRDNIKKLILKSYLILIGRGVTIGK